MKQEVLEKKKKICGMLWESKRKKIIAQWQEIKRERDEIKSKWKKMTKENEKWFKCMYACENLEVINILSHFCL